MFDEFKRKLKEDHSIFIFLFTIIFFIVHAIYVKNYGKTYSLRNNYILQIIIRLSTWTVPVFIYLIIDKENPIKYLKLNKNIMKGIKWGTLIGIAIVVYNVIGAYIIKGHVNFNFNIGEGVWLKAIILVGLSEEVFFRGFVLQKYQELSNFWMANAINAALFTLVHIISWIILKDFILSARLYAIVFMLVFSLFQGHVLKKTESLWACMIIHSFNNFVSLTLQ